MGRKVSTGALLRMRGASYPGYLAHEREHGELLAFLDFLRGSRD